MFSPPMKRIMFDVFLKEIKIGQRNWMIVMMNKKVISDFGRKKYHNWWKKSLKSKKVVGIFDEHLT
jgi:hypothetical protein